MRILCTLKKVRRGKMGVIELIKGWWQGPEAPLSYPRDFAIIDFSKISLRLGVKDDKNKVILRYFINKFGNYELKKYRYSEERVHLLREIHKIPIFDKTKLNLRFPVYSRISPGEAKFIIAR